MMNGWMKKISLVLMIGLTLGTVACGAGGESDDFEDVLNEGSAQAEQNNGGSTQFFDGGSITSDGGSISASFDDGTSFTSD